MRTIREIRRRLILTQAELAILLGKSISTIQRWEADEVRLKESRVLEEWAKNPHFSKCPNS